LQCVFRTGGGQGSVRQSLLVARFNQFERI
jgi:hypothetical protein